MFYWLHPQLAPPPIEPKGEVKLSFPPRFGEHNQEVYSKLGYDVEELKGKGVI
jgi:hypothetical protein